MDKSILNLIDSAKELLLPDETDYQAPNRVFLYCHFLAPVTFTENLNELANMYLPMLFNINQLVEFGKNDSFYTIIHGHTEDELCSAPTFCHLLGYRPDSTNSPAFRKVFQQKWNY